MPLQLKKTIRGKFIYLSALIKDYKVGTLSRSSRFVIKKILENLDLENCEILEYGAGDGVITKEILKRTKGESRLVALETNKKLAGKLKEVSDKRLVVIEENVLDYLSNHSESEPRINVVISGIPLSLLKKEEREKIVEDTRRILKEGGVFVVYQNSPLVKPLLQKHFGKVKSSFEPRNFLPYFIMKAQK